MNIRKLLSSAAAVAIAATMLTLSSPPAAHAVSGTCSVKYKKTENLAIPDNNAADGVGWRAITVNNLPAASTIYDFNLRLNITHTWDADLDIYTWNGVDANSQAVSTDNGGSGDNYTNTLFDSQAGTAITSGAAPFTGTFQPEVTFTNLTGLAANRTYYLWVADDDVAATGTLVDWTVELIVANCDDDGDGTWNDDDKCPDLAAGSPSGCPLADRTLTMNYSGGAYRGVLDSGVSECQSGMNVAVFKVRPGPDLKIGAVLTNGTGQYSLFKPRGSGKFYAKTKGKVVLNVAACRQAQSPYRNL